MAILSGRSPPTAEHLHPGAPLVRLVLAWRGTGRPYHRSGAEEPLVARNLAIGLQLRDAGDRPCPSRKPRAFPAAHLGASAASPARAGR